ncbi:MAG: methylmalonyl Co-A mutase-associated GTPase MeaB [Candidatus Dormibacteria bacterium]
MDKGALLQGDTRALARAISELEQGAPGTGLLVRELQEAATPKRVPNQVVGVTGPPGSGKSTLVDGLTERWRAEGRRVAILAVDPNSPFSGGAILGDRVRMQRHALDPGVFIRSMGARGHLGGVALATRGAVRLLDALGWERVVVETVGVGQSELEVCEIADTVVVVTTPVTGDGVQAIKAGITEVADIFAVNKADLPGADRVRRELKDLVRRPRDEAGWRVPVLETVAAQGGQGVGELAAALEAHRVHLRESGQGQVRAQRRLRDQAVELVAARAAAFARSELERGGEGLLSEDPARADPEAAAERILERLGRSGRKMRWAGRWAAALKR